MRRNLNGLLSFTFSRTCLNFTVITLLVTLVNLGCGAERMRLATLLELLLQALLAAVFAYIAFTDHVIRQGGTAKRYFVFLSLLAPQIGLFGWLLGWFDGLSSAMWTVGIALGCFVVATGLILIFEKARQKQYQEKLEEYRKKRES